MMLSAFGFTTQSSELKRRFLPCKLWTCFTLPELPCWVDDASSGLYRLRFLDQVEAISQTTFCRVNNGKIEELPSTSSSDSISLLTFLLQLQLVFLPRPACKTPKTHVPEIYLRFSFFTHMIDPLQLQIFSNERTPQQENKKSFSCPFLAEGHGDRATGVGNSRAWAYRISQLWITSLLKKKN